MKTSLISIAIGSILFTLPLSAQALETTINGFVNVTAGKILSGHKEDYIPPPTFPNTETRQTYHCPCYAGNWENAGIYESGSWNATAETSFGLQGNFTIDDRLSATLQVVGRGANSFKADVDWAYISYELTPKLLLQAGHKRLPIYYYSDFMYVGYAYPWVRPPQDLYGWQVYDYNGANLLYRDSYGDWSMKANLWTGESRREDNIMMSKLYYGGRIEEAWKDIIGGYVDFSNDYVGMRLVTMRNKVDRNQYTSGVSHTLHEDVAQSFLGLALNGDWNNFILRSEINQFTRPVSRNIYKSYLAGGGYKLGQVTLMLTRSKFREIARNWEEIEAHSTNSATLRWDFNKAAALKLQYDKARDESKYNLLNGNENGFLGNTKLLTVSLQASF